MSSRELTTQCTSLCVCTCVWVHTEAFSLRNKWPSRCPVFSGTGLESWALKFASSNDTDPSLLTQQETEGLLFLVCQPTAQLGREKEIKKENAKLFNMYN